MPYEIRKDGPESKPFCVYKKDTEDKMGCHVSHDKAAAQIAAIEASEADRGKDSSPLPVQEIISPAYRAVVDALKETISPLIEMLKPFVDNLSTPDEEDDVDIEIEGIPLRVVDFPVPEVDKTEDVEEEEEEGDDSENEDEEEEENVEKDDSQLVIYKQEDGRYRWVGVSSTAFIDRDEEIVSVEALEKISKEMRGDFGPLLLWHWPDLGLGTCDFRIQDGVCLVESGLWNEDGISIAVRKEVERNPHVWGMSIRFLGSLLTVSKDVIFKGRTIKNIWRDIIVKERSLLPAVYASNRYSSFSTGGNEMEDTKREALKQLLGPETAEQVIAVVDSLTAKAQEGSDVYKEAEDTEVPVPPEETPAESTQESVQKEERQVEDSTEINEAILDTLKQMSARMGELEKELTELKADSSPRAALMRASHSEETVDQEASKQVAAGEPKASPVIADITDALLGRMRGE